MVVSQRRRARTTVSEPAVADGCIHADIDPGARPRTPPMPGSSSQLRLPNSQYRPPIAGLSSTAIAAGAGSTS